MHFIALFALLPLLTPTFALPNHDANLAQRDYRQQHHRRAAAAAVSAVSPNKVKVKRKVKRRGVCGAKNGTADYVSSSPSSVVSVTTSLPANYNAAVKPPSSTGDSTPAPSSTSALLDDSLAIYSSAEASASAAYVADFAVGASSAPAPAAAAASSSLVSSAASASASAASSGSASSSSGGASVGGKPALTPNGMKAGITLCDGIDAFVGHISWCTDWTPNPSPPSGVIGASMLWGDGSLASDDDAQRLSLFKAITTSPAYVIGPEEPDCSTAGSADMSVGATASLWDNVIAPHGTQGSLLISPSMCHQADETFLTPFKAAITTPWDVTNLHINKLDMAGVKKDLDHYWNTYGKPMWVTEFACVEDSSWTPCTDQGTINQFISDIVDLFESDSRVYAYAYSNGEGLGDVWPAISNGAMTSSGKAYLSAISKYH